LIFTQGDLLLQNVDMVVGIVQEQWRGIKEKLVAMGKQYGLLE
jgi:hypothetical protein